MGGDLTFEKLVKAIQNVHKHFSTQAIRAVNISLTLRNWIVGLYIYEYEQNGLDRARYGEYLLEKLADRLRKAGMKRVDPRELRRYRQLYLTYPQIGEALTPESRAMLPIPDLSIPIREPVVPEFKVNGKTILEKLSFTHLAELIKIDDPVKRAFYEVECIRGNWSVRELKVDAFSHEYIGQLNTYVSWYKKNVMAEDDNPPIGILLCTKKDQTLVEYALAGMDNNLFVSRYQLELPSKEEMQRFLEEKIREVGE